LPIIDVAMASGFASLRRFNALLRARYRMTPGELRRSSASRAADQLAFEIAYRPPYDWPAIAAFLEKRAIAGVECVDARGYHRTLRLERQGKAFAGWISVAPARKRAALRIIVSPSLAGALPAVLARVKQLFDVACRPDEIAQALGPLRRTIRAFACRARSTDSRSPCARSSASR
jgi:AraC family transcriptional regulator of adaptative response / DNA-3-methyladenine glycosylase II